MMYLPSHVGLASKGLVQQRLQLAQKKLLDAHTPALLRFTYYLRVCCAVMPKVDWANWSSLDSAPTSPLSYSKLLAALSQHNPDWWHECYISETHVLQSNDPVIQPLLAPIAALYAEEGAIAFPPAPPSRIQPPAPSPIAV